MGTVVVVGLLPPQAQRIAEEFPRRGLKFIPRDREREVPELIRGFDHVLVMTKFISHVTWHQVPSSKVVPINGGLTQLKAKLAKLLPPEEAHPEEPPIMATLVDYSALRTAKPGDRLFFKRPHGTSKKKHWSAVGVSRSYYKTHHGIVTEQHEADGGIDIVVNGTVPLGTPVAKPEAVPEVFHESLQQFWMDAYLHLISACPGLPDGLLASRSDAAVAALRQRFPEAA